jgi:hypothetical protein
MFRAPPAGHERYRSEPASAFRGSTFWGQPVENPGSTPRLHTSQGVETMDETKALSPEPPHVESTWKPGKLLPSSAITAETLEGNYRARLDVNAASNY